MAKLFNDQQNLHVRLIYKNYLAILNKKKKDKTKLFQKNNLI
jgi:hypothetical protein